MKHLILILLIAPMSLMAQLESLKFGAPMKWKYEKNVMRGIDTLTLDSVIINDERYLKKSKDGDTIEILKQHYSYKLLCNHEGPPLTGEYASYYPNRQIKEYGSIRCNRKAKEWYYFYDSGSLQKYEIFQSEPLMINVYDDHSYRSGPYAEYYENGNPRTVGTYKLVEKWMPYTDFNFETYEEKEICCSWQIVSIKDGFWYEYMEDGSLISKENTSMDLSLDKIFI